jgi:hypothetical protein
MSTLTDLIARHHPNRDEAIKLIGALALVIDAASSHAEDWQSGLDDGTYEDTQDALDRLTAALEVVEG